MIEYLRSLFIISGLICRGKLTSINWKLIDTIESGTAGILHIQQVLCDRVLIFFADLIFKLSK